MIRLAEMKSVWILVIARPMQFVRQEVIADIVSVLQATQVILTLVDVERYPKLILDVGKTKNVLASMHVSLRTGLALAEIHVLSMSHAQETQNVRFMMNYHYVS